MAACRLAGRGMSILVVDRQTLPRPKACGGALPNGVRALVDWDIDRLIEARVWRQEFVQDFNGRSEVEQTMEPALFVERARFDHHFVERAVALGAGRVSLRQGLFIRHAAEDEDGVQLTATSGEAIRCSYLIAADGASSHVARSIGLFRAPAGAAVDATVRLTPEALERARDRATFEFGCVPAGYGWIFPKRDHVSCGVGSWRRPRELASKSKAFLGRAFSADLGDVLVNAGAPRAGLPGTSSRRDAAHLPRRRLRSPRRPGGGGRHFIRSREREIAADVVAALWARDHSRAGALQELERIADEARSPGAASATADCGLYDRAIRYGVARRLNLIRLAAVAHPDAYYRSLVAA